MADTGAPQKMRFDYLKSPLFRMIHADGVVGGPTPKGLLFLSFFNERMPIPQQIVHTIDQVESAGTAFGQPTFRARLGEEILAERVSRESIIRETEVGVLLDLPTAEKLHDWLSTQIVQMRRASDNGETK